MTYGRPLQPNVALVEGSGSPKRIEGDGADSAHPAAARSAAVAEVDARSSDPNDPAIPQHHARPDARPDRRPLRRYAGADLQQHALELSRPAGSRKSARRR